MTMQDIIAILDAHEGAISAIATTVLVVVAIYTLIINIKLWLAQDKPRLSFIVKEWHRPIENVRFGAYVKNLGKGPAFDIRFRVDTRSFFLDTPLASMEELPICPVPENERKAEGVQFTEIHYKDINGITYEQELETKTPIYYEPRIIK